jgi:hypothetical protein
VVQRLAKPVYESLPLLWALGGVICLAISYWQRAKTWSGFVAIAGLGSIVFAIALWLHRRDYRKTSAEYSLRGRPPGD